MCVQVDEGWDAADDALLPSLKSVCADDLPYHRKVIPVVVKVLPLFSRGVLWRRGC